MKATRPSFNKSPFKASGFSIVVHNVCPDVKSQAELFCQTSFNNCRRYITSVEPYSDESGHHLHIFIQASGKHRWNSTKVSSWWKKSFYNLVLELDEYPSGQYGRLQVDALIDWDAAVKYLMDPEKDKVIDPSACPVDLLIVQRQQEYDWSNDQMSSMFVSQFTGEYSTGRSIIKEYESKNIPLPTFWKNVQNIWERGPPTFA